MQNKYVFGNKARPALDFYTHFLKSDRCGVSRLLRMLVLCLLIPNIARAADLDLTWAASRTSTVTGYLVRVGSKSGAYETTIDVGKVLSYRLAGLTAGRDYFVVVQTYTSRSSLSLPSNEVHVFVPSVAAAAYTTTTIASTDPDFDGLATAQELALKTNPLNADTDGDGVRDGQEIQDRSNPLDPNDFLRPLSSQVCAEWNGYLGVMASVVEQTNMSSRYLHANTSLYNSAGVLSSQISMVIAPWGQNRLKVNNLPGWELNKVGVICTSHDGGINELDLQMVYSQDYLVESFASLLQYSYALSFKDSLHGKQWLHFNTYELNTRGSSSDNYVRNYIQVSNDTKIQQQGTLLFYDPTGSILGGEKVSLLAGEQAVYPVQRYGTAIAGFVEWSPSLSSGRFTVRALRALQDKADPFMVLAPTGSKMLPSSELKGGQGNSGIVSAPVFTNQRSAVLEVSNVLEITITVDVNLAVLTGAEKANFVLTLAPRSSKYLLLDKFFLGVPGIVTLMPSVTKAVIGTVTHYVKDATGAISYVYGTQFAEMPLK